MKELMLDKIDSESKVSETPGAQKEFLKNLGYVSTHELLADFCVKSFEEKTELIANQIKKDPKFIAAANQLLRYNRHLNYNDEKDKNNLREAIVEAIKLSYPDKVDEHLRNLFIEGMADEGSSGVAEDRHNQDIPDHNIPDNARPQDEQERIKKYHKSLSNALYRYQNQVFDYAMDQLYPYATFSKDEELQIYSEFLEILDENKERKKDFIESLSHTYSREMMKNDPWIQKADDKAMSYEEFWNKFYLPVGYVRNLYVDFVQEHINNKDREYAEGIIKRWKQFEDKYNELIGPTIHRIYNDKQEDDNIGGEEKEKGSSVVEEMFRKYDSIIEKVRTISKNKIIKLLNKNRELSESEIENVTNQLIKTANQLLEKQIIKFYINNSKDEEIRSELKKVDERVLLLGEIISILSRQEIADIDIIELADIDKIIDLPACELLEKPQLLDQILKMIKEQFPKADEGEAEDSDEFLEECKNNKNLRLTFTMVNGKVLCLYGKEKKSKNIEYLDWFIANPDAPIKGLGEATTKLEFTGERGKDKSHYLVAKPHVKSFLIAIEKLGFLGVGSTEDDEYKHHYARAWRPAEREELISKDLDKEDDKKLCETLKRLCCTDNKIEHLVFEGKDSKGKELRAARISYHGQTYHDDIKKEEKKDPDGWILGELDRQYSDGYVLTRFIPADESKENQVFYAVWEENPAKKAEKNELDSVIANSINGKQAEEPIETRKRSAA